MKKVLFHGDAEKELLSSVEYYEDQQKDLGRRFLASVQDAINRILINPQLYPKSYQNIRRCRVTAFPYGVIYEEFDNHIIIYAVLHAKRKPGYWEERI